MTVSQRDCEAGPIFRAKLLPRNTYKVYVTSRVSTPKLPLLLLVVLDAGDDGGTHGTAPTHILSQEP